MKMINILYTMDFYDQHCYRVCKFCASIVGIWPYQSHKVIYIACGMWAFIFSVQITPQIVYLYKHYTDKDVVFSSVLSFIVDAFGILNHITALIYRKELRHLYNRIKFDWSLLNDKEKETLRTYANTGMLMGSVYLVFAYAALSVYLSEPCIPKIIGYLQNNDSIPGRFLAPMDYMIIDQEKYYWSLFALSNFCVTSLVTVVFNSDVMFISLLQHVCGLFDILGERIKKESTEINKSINYIKLNHLKVSNDIEFEYCVQCILMHKRAIKFSQILEYVYCKSFGFALIMNLVLASLTTLQMIAELDSIQSVIKNVTFSISQLFHLFFYCFLSQQLMDKSFEFQKHIAFRAWYSNSLQAQKLLIMMTLRSQTPCILTGAKLVVMSLETFIQMVKTAVSYGTFLLQMQDF